MSELSFREIKQLTNGANYRVNQSWQYLIEALEGYKGRYLHLDLDPEFQRGHVWTEQQQIAYVNFKLRGGSGSNEIQFNCAGWMGDFRGPFVLVDGKQRLQAVLRFLNDDLPVLHGEAGREKGWLFSEIGGRLPYNIDFLFCVNNLATMEEVYKWYIELNSGGTPHTEEELNKVRAMLNQQTRNN